MAYADRLDFVDAFGERETLMLTNLDNPNATAINPVPLNKALDDATAEINTYVASRYIVPLASTPTVVNRYCLDIARYMLDRIRSREDVRLRYEDALKWLGMLASGKVSIGADLLGTNISQTAPSLDASGARSTVAPAIDLGGYWRG
jgi:phage gp36-like protein